MTRTHTLATPVLCTVAALAASAALAVGPSPLPAPSPVAASAAAQESAEDRPGRLTFDDLFEEDHTGRRPTQTAWNPDGDALTYVWDDGDGEALWRMDAATGQATRLLDVAELAPAATDTQKGNRDEQQEDRAGEADKDPEGEEARAGEAEGAEAASLDAYHWSPAGDALLLESGGDLWLLRPGAGEEERLTRLTATEAAEEDPAFSPDGTKLAYVREADLYLLEVPAAAGSDGSSAGEPERSRNGAPGSDPEPAGTPGERALTTDGEPGTTLNGTTSWVYWEEIWGRDATGFWWSPDSTRIAYYRFDETPVGEYTLLPDYRPEYPEPEVQSYPKAGTTNPEVRLGILELATGETTWLEADTPEEESYQARLHWTPDGTRVAVERLTREQDRLDLLLCAPASGACETALTDGHPTWVNLGKETTFLPDGRLLWASERTGRRHLYLYSSPEDGLRLLGALTSGPWGVTSVDLVEDGEVFATAHGTGTMGAARRRLLRIRFGDGASLAPEIQELAGDGLGARGWHGARVAPGGRFLLHRWSHADDPGWERIEALDRNGDAGDRAAGPVTAELPSRPPAYDPAALPSWRFLEVPGPDGTALPAALLEPAGAGGGTDGEGAEPPRTRPVIMYHYGGPGSQVVVDRWSTRGRALWHKMMAQRGFGVLMVDNPASAFFGKAGEDLQHRRFGEVNLAAQRAGTAYLEGVPWADPDRVGLWGWSGGGTNTLYSLLRSPGTWRAGVAGAPVTDWRYYDTIWTERYLDHPEDNPEGYRASSPRTHAAELRDRLLIVHGTADDNVHPQHTMALIHDWTEAGIPFEVAIYPGEKHGFGDAASRHFYERMTAFFERTLREP